VLGPAGIKSPKLVVMQDNKVEVVANVDSKVNPVVNRANVDNKANTADNQANMVDKQPIMLVIVVQDAEAIFLFEVEVRGVVGKESRRILRRLLTGNILF
jgi:hypothetical protein